jgi:hypothetical protein
LGLVDKCVQPDLYKRTKEDQAAYIWCINHGVCIGMLAAFEGFKNQHWKIRIVANGKEMISPGEYNKYEILPKLFEMYRHYYNKRK